jgi:hypothetical protein
VISIKDSARKERGREYSEILKYKPFHPIQMIYIIGKSQGKEESLPLPIFLTGATTFNFPGAKGNYDSMSFTIDELVKSQKRVSSRAKRGDLIFASS